MIYLVRHGEAASSWGTHPDPGLSETGMLQAKDAASVLKSRGITNAITSPMQRCRETAKEFARVSALELTVESAVTEIPTPHNIGDRIHWLRGLMSGSWKDAPEIVEDWRSNLLEAVHALPDHTVVFTHFVAINAIVGALDQLDEVTVFRPNYCSITKLEKDASKLNVVERGQSLDTRVL